MFIPFDLGVLDVMMMYGAYSTSRRLAVTRIFLRFVWFSCASVFLSFLYVYVLLSKHLYLISFSACLSYVNNKLPFILVVFFKYRKALQEESKQNSNSVFFRLYMIVVGIYAGVQFFISFLMRIPACHHMTNQCDHWPFIRFVKWMRQVFLLPFLLAKLFLLYAWFSFYVLNYIFWSIVKMVTVLCPWIVFLFNILGVF
jgi:callose synthase